MKKFSSGYSYLFNVLKLASVHHAKQTRKSDRLPYINHLIDVANILIEYGNVSCEDEIAAALLHDIIEDTDLEMKALKSQVSDKTFSIVVCLTDDKTLPLERRRVETVNKLKASEDSTKRVKLADICSNIAAPPIGWPASRLLDSYKHNDAVAEACRDGSQSLFNEYHKRRLLYC